MNVKELKEALAEYPDHVTVQIVASPYSVDIEGIQTFIDPFESHKHQPTVEGIALVASDDLYAH